MEKNLTALLILFASASFGQTSTKIDSLTFCTAKYKVPAGCIAESEYQIKCDNYIMVWLYLSEQMLQFMPDQFVNQQASKLKKFRKESITCYILGKRVNGYKISYKKDRETGYQLIAYGNINGQPILVQLLLDNEAASNNDIPKFPRQIIRLTN